MSEEKSKPVKKKNKLLSVEQKLELIDLVREGRTIISVGREHSVPESSIRGFMKKEAELRQQLKLMKNPIAKPKEVYIKTHEPVEPPKPIVPPQQGNSVQDGAVIDRCRLCSEQFKKYYVHLTPKHESQFQYVTNIPFRRSEKFMNIGCVQCCIDLNRCFETKQKFIANQEKLRELENDPEVKVKVEQEDEEMEIKVDPVHFGIKYWLDVAKNNSRVFKDPLNVNLMEVSDSELQQLESNEQQADLTEIDLEEILNSNILCPEPQPVAPKPPKVDRNKEKIQCEYCNKIITRGALRDHLACIHGHGKLYMCDLCVYKTNSRKSFKKHFTCHLKEKKFQCPYCPKAYVTKPKLTCHITVFHEKRYEKFCQYCGKNYINAFVLENHVRRAHTKQNIFLCDRCSFSTSSKSSLRNHMLRRHGPKNLKVCEICSAKVAALHSHMRTHKGAHIPCTYILDDGTTCERKFRNNSTLQEHIDIDHKMLMKYDCKHCTMVFRKKTQLYAHIRSAHIKKKWNCVVPGCKVLFKSKKCVFEHLRMSHRELSDAKRKEYRIKARNIPLPSIDDFINKD